MKNKIGDLRNHLFEQLEKIADNDLTPQQLETEVIRSEWMVNISSTIIDSARVENEYIELLVKSGEKIPAITDFMKKID